MNWKPLVFQFIVQRSSFIVPSMGRAFDTNQTVGEYRILDFLGAGGMGEVYRSMHSKIGRLAAVKVLTAQAAQGSGFVERFFNEGRIQANLKHPNVATLYDFCIAKGQDTQQLTQAGSVIGTLQYLAPELIRGGTADASGDLWALGVQLYEMVTGRMPFDANTV